MVVGSVLNYTTTWHLLGIHSQQAEVDANWLRDPKHKTIMIGSDIKDPEGYSLPIGAAGKLVVVMGPV